MRRLTYALFHTFTYAQSETRVDSPIDDALKARGGVCQDLAHIMIALARSIGIPCRYVSGYLSTSSECHDRSAEGATHAWAEAYLPELGWVGFDPTNDCSQPSGTFAWPWAATMRTCHRRAECFAAKRVASSPFSSRCRWRTRPFVRSA